jgi:predicted secreted protein
MENQITLSTIETKIGESFVIDLNSDPSNGYSWKIEQLDQSLIKFIKEDFTPCAQELGSDMIQSLHFMPIMKGTSFIELSYEQTWDSNDTHIRAFKIEIH